MHRQLRMQKLNRDGMRPLRRLKCLKGGPIIKAENAKSLGVEDKIWQRFIILKMMKISPE